MVDYEIYQALTGHRKQFLVVGKNHVATAYDAAKKFFKCSADHVQVIPVWVNGEDLYLTKRTSKASVKCALFVIGGEFMPGRTFNQTVSTIQALDNFVYWLECKMRDHKMSQGDLARKLDVERKTVCAIMTKKRQPKLDFVVRCFDYFGEAWVYVRFDKDIRQI